METDNIIKLPGGRVGPRPICEIAAEVRKTWPNVYFGAVPYLDAMASLRNIGDNFYQDSGREVVLYFLANATAWRGPDARRIKAELKRILAGK